MERFDNQNIITSSGECLDLTSKNFKSPKCNQHAVHTIVSGLNFTCKTEAYIDLY